MYCFKMFIFFFFLFLLFLLFYSFLFFLLFIYLLPSLHSPSSFLQPVGATFILVEAAGTFFFFLHCLFFFFLLIFLFSFFLFFFLFSFLFIYIYFCHLCTPLMPCSSLWLPSLAQYHLGGDFIHVWCPSFCIWWSYFLWLPCRGHHLITWLWRPEALAFLSPLGL